MKAAAAPACGKVTVEDSTCDLCKPDACDGDVSAWRTAADWEEVASACSTTCQRDGTNVVLVAAYHSCAWRYSCQVRPSSCSARVNRTEYVPTEWPWPVLRWQLNGSIVPKLFAKFDWILHTSLYHRGAMKLRAHRPRSIFLPRISPARKAALLERYRDDTVAYEQACRSGVPRTKQTSKQQHLCRVDTLHWPLLNASCRSVNT